MKKSLPCSQALTGAKETLRAIGAIPVRPDEAWSTGPVSPLSLSLFFPPRSRLSDRSLLRRGSRSVRSCAIITRWTATGPRKIAPFTAISPIAAQIPTTYLLLDYSSSNSQQSHANRHYKLPGNVGSSPSFAFLRKDPAYERWPSRRLFRRTLQLPKINFAFAHFFHFGQGATVLTSKS